MLILWITPYISAGSYRHIPQRTFILPPATVRDKCYAKKFENEPNGFCCANGEVKWLINESPPELLSLFTSNDPLSINSKHMLVFIITHLHLVRSAYTMRNHWLKTPMVFIVSECKAISIILWTTYFHEMKGQNIYSYISMILSMKLKIEQDFSQVYVLI